MKKLYKYLIASLLVIALGACEDILETKNFTDMTPENFFNNDKDVDAAMTALYTPIDVNWGYSEAGDSWYNALYNADANSYLSASFRSTDEMDSYYDLEGYTSFTIGPSGSVLCSVYNMARYVSRITNVIENLETKCPAITQESREAWIAEAKTLRAFYMWILLDWFGPVNVKLDPSSLFSNEIQPRPDMETYVGYIQKDLDDAIGCDSFAEKYNGDEQNWGRMSKSVAHAIAMRLHLHQKDWQAAKKDCETIMGMGFSLLPDYFKVFEASCYGSPEHIFSALSNRSAMNYYITEVLPSEFNIGYNDLGESYMRGTDRASALSGWQNYHMRWDFYDTFSETDVRRHGILCRYELADGTMRDRNDPLMKGPLPIKFMNTQTDEFGTTNDHPIIRYAEVLLSYAEAVNELEGPTAAAVNAVKTVTDRAHVTIPENATKSKEAFKEFLLAERGRELYCEGQRRTDLIRFGKFISSARARGIDAKDYQVLFPIPQKAITEAGGIVEQNPGYTN
jgi:hypothetical protein